MALHGIVLAGGSGTRFWPKSRRHRPKQLLKFGADRSLVEEAVARVESLVPAERILLLSNEAYAAELRRLLPGLPPDAVLGEPAPRDTAAALGLGALIVEARDRDGVVLATPADQKISPLERFEAAVRAAEQTVAAHPGHLVVFGIRPTRPATGYGYVQRGEPLQHCGDVPVFEVASFREKPDLETARRFLEEGGFDWNAGMFCFRAATLLEALARHQPELARGLQELRPAVGTPDFLRVLAELYPALPRISIDFGVMEHYAERAVVGTDFEWDDVGSWTALERHHPADGDGNVGVGEVVALDARHNLVDAGDGLVALVGVEDLVVVRTDDVTLVCRRDQAERVKELLAEISRRDDSERYL